MPNFELSETESIENPFSDKSDDPTAEEMDEWIDADLDNISFDPPSPPSRPPKTTPPSSVNEMTASNRSLLLSQIHPAESREHVQASPSSSGAAHANTTTGTTTATAQDCAATAESEASSDAWDTWGADSPPADVHSGSNDLTMTPLTLPSLATEAGQRRRSSPAGVDGPPADKHSKSNDLLVIPHASPSLATEAAQRSSSSSATPAPSPHQARTGETAPWHDPDVTTVSASQSDELSAADDSECEASNNAAADECGDEVSNDCVHDGVTIGDNKPCKVALPAASRVDGGKALDVAAHDDVATTIPDAAAAHVGISQPCIVADSAAAGDDGEASDACVAATADATDVGAWQDARSPSTETLPLCALDVAVDVVHVVGGTDAASGTGVAAATAKGPSSRLVESPAPSSPDPGPPSATVGAGRTSGGIAVGTADDTSTSTADCSCDSPTQQVSTPTRQASPPTWQATSPSQRITQPPPPPAVDGSTPVPSPVPIPSPRFVKDIDPLNSTAPPHMEPLSGERDETATDAASPLDWVAGVTASQQRNNIPLATLQPAVSSSRRDTEEDVPLVDVALDEESAGGGGGSVGRGGSGGWGWGTGWMKVPKMLREVAAGAAQDIRELTDTFQAALAEVAAASDDDDAAAVAAARGHSTRAVRAGRRSSSSGGVPGRQEARQSSCKRRTSSSGGGGHDALQQQQRSEDGVTVERQASEAGDGTAGGGEGGSGSGGGGVVDKWGRKDEAVAEGRHTGEDEEGEAGNAAGAGTDEEAEEDAEDVEEDEESPECSTALDRLHDSSEDTKLGMGLKAVDERVEHLAVGATKALGSLWGGLNRVAQGGWSLAVKVDAAAKGVARELAAQSSLHAEQPVEGAPRRSTSSGAASSESSQHQRRPVVQAPHEPASFDDFFYVYGGAQLCEELEALTNESSRMVNKSRSRLEASQQEQLDAILAALIPIFASDLPTMTCQLLRGSSSSSSSHQLSQLATAATSQEAEPTTRSLRSRNADSAETGSSISGGHIGPLLVDRAATAATPAVSVQVPAADVESSQTDSCNGSSSAAAAEAAAAAAAASQLLAMYEPVAFLRADCLAKAGHFAELLERAVETGSRPEPTPPKVAAAAAAAGAGAASRSADMSTTMEEQSTGWTSHANESPDAAGSAVGEVGTIPSGDADISDLSISHTSRHPGMEAGRTAVVAGGTSSPTTGRHMSLGEPSSPAPRTADRLASSTQHSSPLELSEQDDGDALRLAVDASRSDPGPDVDGAVATMTVASSSSLAGAVDDGTIASSGLAGSVSDKMVVEAAAAAEAATKRACAEVAEAAVTSAVGAAKTQTVRATCAAAEVGMATEAAAEAAAAEALGALRPAKTQLSKRLAEVSTAQVQLLLLMAQSLAAPARVGRPLDDGVVWPASACEQARLLRNEAERMVADVGAIVGAYSSVLQKALARTSASATKPPAAPPPDDGSGASKGDLVQADPAAAAAGASEDWRAQADPAAAATASGGIIAASVALGAAPAADGPKVPPAVAPPPLWVRVARALRDEVSAEGATAAARAHEGFRSLLYVVLLRAIVTDIA